MSNNYNELRVHEISVASNSTNANNKSKDRKNKNKNKKDSGFLSVMVDTMKDSPNLKFRKSMKVNEDVNPSNAKKTENSESTQADKENSGFDISI